MRPKLRRWMSVALVGALTVVLLAEVSLRWFWGLGDPLLYQTDDSIEYLLQPDQQVRRLGNRISINEWSMRGDPWIDSPASRCLVIGDSIVFAGDRVDQEAIPAEVARRRLQDLGHGVQIGTIATKSWGPPNYLAYIRRYGTFGAEHAVIVCSSHDASDVPEFLPLDPASAPTTKPLSALGELATKVWARYSAGERGSPAMEGDAERRRSTALAALAETIGLLRDRGCRVAMLLHWSRSELAAGQAGEGMADLLALAEAHGVPCRSIVPRNVV